jgi:hypothetical protein
MGSFREPNTSMTGERVYTRDVPGPVQERCRNEFEGIRRKSDGRDWMRAEISAGAADFFY